MSRSDHARVLTFGKRSAPAAIGCMLVLSTGCRFSTSPGEMLVASDAGVQMAPAQVEVDEAPIARPMFTSTTTMPTSTLDAAVAAAVGSEDAAANGSDAGSPLQAAPAAGASPAAVHSPSGSSAPTQPSAGASAPSTPVAGTVSSMSPPSAAGSPGDAKDAACSVDLANCLLRAPLAYAECLRANQDNGCAEPDAGAPTTSPITTEDGKPLSQACQAELANCIARLPTPQNAASCTEEARKCK